MTEILTESFCERCGSRYTFESSAPRKSRVGRIKVFSKGVRNFVLTDDSSFSEAMAEARSEEEQVVTVHQLDAFHRTFNFCLNCRQYTCGSCWNPGEGRCLTCAPDPALEAAAAAAAPVAEGSAEPVALAAEGSAEPLAMAAEPPGAIEVGPIAADAWPDQDVPLERLTMAVGAPPAIDAEPEAEVDDDPEPPGRLDIRERDEEPVARLEADGTEEWAAPVAGAEGDSHPLPSSVHGVAPGETLEEAIAAWEARQPAEDVPVEAAVEAEPVAASALEAVPHTDDVVPQPTWPTAATPTQPVPAVPTEPVPAVPTEPAPSPVEPVPAEPVPPVPAPWLTIAPDDGATEPQWPTTPAWPQPGQRPYVPTTVAGRPVLPQGDVAAVWAASAREVLFAAPASLPAAAAAPTAQPCVACGLSLSANARFCRRCGSRQA